jgi:hypothetical protein
MLNINNKPWEKLRTKDIISFFNVLEDESFFFEFKSDDIKPDHLIKEVSAFANTYGGYIFLGVDDYKNFVGCSKWTEQRIHSVMHDCITPIPNFDVKTFNIDNSKIHIIKIEEGTLPPYITNKGQIFERVSSGSFVVKDSAKLSQIYYKNKEQLNSVELKLSLEPLRPIPIIAENLYAYLDFGFSTVFSESTVLQKNLVSFDFQPLCDFLNSKDVRYSISRLGTSILISYGDVGFNPYILGSGLHNFIEIMNDGSVKGRIILLSFGHSNKVDISSLLINLDVFKKIYSMIFDKSYLKSFIYALKYEKLTVLKQFIPYYSTQDNGYLRFIEYLNKHIEKYGENLIVKGGRYPYVGLKTIDKKYFDDIKEKYNYKNLLNKLFPNAFATFGFVDPIQ